MTGSKRNTLFVVNMIIPLVLGLAIYLTKAERTYISDAVPWFRSMIIPVRYPHLIRAYACDFLWSYSLFFCFRLTLGEELKGKHNIVVVTLAAITSITLESLQLISGFPGKFDWLDIVTELIAILVAYIITTSIEWRVQHEEQ